ncbi:MAG: phosphoribosylaminoimidazolesuccinocarboxamide synthase [Lewinellaceae bacterium]|nr:phosphoribosylaminoimidazolesuccinocarboxamide synthase [Saprospiraceae bacterium]MCB9313826.1 phosphoribosylaminoimidazolesuccinocarboxamide synthase [Lewinellaceae bacterium]HRW74876.1 phosphoribosylaminoimidazolesuccinocarboxamide synthase [Saprospiraceae bacterium]
MTNVKKPVLASTAFSFPGQDMVYHGKVRDLYRMGGLLMLVATDRISAFDHILPRSIPFKGQVLNQLAAYFLRATADEVPNWLIDTPDPNVAVGHYCEPIRIEMVIRGYLTGHAWRTYRSGARTLCGVPLPEGMRENDPFPTPIITPSTKATEGHDEDISADEILARGLATPEQWDQLVAYTNTLFQLGTRMARERGLILVDTKYEFGMFEGQMMVMDEIHTPDSSRYFYLDGFEERQARGEAQMQLSKEFVREWLMDHGFQGKEGQEMPIMPDLFVEQISQRYIQLYEQVTGQTFVPDTDPDPADRIERAITAFLSERR